MKNADIRLTRLEQSVRRSVQATDYRQTMAYLAMSADDRDRLHTYENRYGVDGHLQDFTDEELHDFERLLMPLANEEQADAKQL